MQVSAGHSHFEKRLPALLLVEISKLYPLLREIAQMMFCMYFLKLWSINFKKVVQLIAPNK